MLTAEEQVFIVYSVAYTSAKLLETACEAVKTFRRPSYVPSVTAKPMQFPLPSGTEPGSSLGTKLSRELINSVGAIVFVDDLRPNVAYELGFLHGQGRFILLVTSSRPDEVWRSISDLAGCALLDLSRSDLTEGIHHYLRDLYRALSAGERFEAPQLPTARTNMVTELARNPRVPVRAQESAFGPALIIDTWGGVVFDLGWELLSEARFKVAARALTTRSIYSIYFSLEFVDYARAKRNMIVGLTSNQAVVGIESNERLFPAQGLSDEWRLFSGSFADLLRRGHVLAFDRVTRLSWVRVRAGGFARDPNEKTDGWELGFFEVAGRSH